MGNLACIVLGNVFFFVLFPFLFLGGSKRVRSIYSNLDLESLVGLPVYISRYLSSRSHLCDKGLY